MYGLFQLTTNTWRGAVGVLGGQLDEDIPDSSGVEVCAADVGQHDFVGVRLAARCFGRSLGYQCSKRLQGWSGGEYRLHALASDLGAYQPRPDVEQALITLVGVDPLEFQRRPACESEGFCSSGQ